MVRCMHHLVELLDGYGYGCTVVLAVALLVLRTVLLLEHQATLGTAGLKC